jgi:hypothetical protein
MKWSIEVFFLNYNIFLITKTNSVRLVSNYPTLPQVECTKANDFVYQYSVKSFEIVLFAILYKNILSGSVILYVIFKRFILLKHEMYPIENDNIIIKVNKINNML